MNFGTAYRPRSIYQYSNMGPRLSGLTSIFGVVFFVSKSPLVFFLVEFRIPGYPGPSKDQGTEVRLMRGKIFRGKIRM